MRNGVVSKMSQELLEKKFTRKGSFVGQASENEYYVSLGEDKVYALTAGAFYIWSRCDGNRTLKEIIENLSNEANIEYKELEKPVIELVNEFVNLGLVE